MILVDRDILLLYFMGAIVSESILSFSFLNTPLQAKIPFRIHLAVNFSYVCSNCAYVQKNVSAMCQAGGNKH